MKYKNIIKGTFISRPNRFIAKVLINEKEEICHVKNTGRCKELLIPVATVFLEESDNQNRKTKFDLVSVYKNEVLFNIDSQAPNKAMEEWLNTTDYFGNINYIKPECKYKNSRFDFYIETDTDKIFIEVKGVTLEHNGILMFPDAPTERGRKHILELCDCIENGYKAYIFFVIQTEKGQLFKPNRLTDPEFADALEYALDKGVNIKCINCTVTPAEMKIKDFIEYYDERNN